MKYLLLLTLLIGAQSQALTCKAKGKIDGIKTITINDQDIVFINHLNTHIKFTANEDGQVIKTATDSGGTYQVYLSKNESHYYLSYSVTPINKDDPCSSLQDETFSGLEKLKCK